MTLKREKLFTLWFNLDDEEFNGWSRNLAQKQAEKGTEDCFH